MGKKNEHIKSAASLEFQIYIAGFLSDSFEKTPTLAMIEEGEGDDRG